MGKNTRISKADEEKIVNLWSKKYKNVEGFLLDINTQERLGQMVNQCGINKFIDAIESINIENSNNDDEYFCATEEFKNLIYSGDFSKIIGYVEPEYKTEWTDEMIENDYLNIKRL